MSRTASRLAPTRRWMPRWIGVVAARVLGSELGTGTLDGDGKVRLAATWAFRGIEYRAEYNGTLGASGGTLSGTQYWRGGRGASGSRTCSIAVVPAPQG